MTRPKADEGIFLGESSVEFVVALEVTFVEHLDGIFLSRCTVCAVYHGGVRSFAKDVTELKIVCAETTIRRATARLGL
jgi:hypothetical protein